MSNTASSTISFLLLCSFLFSFVGAPVVVADEQQKAPASPYDTSTLSGSVAALGPQAGLGNWLGQKLIGGGQAVFCAIGAMTFGEGSIKECVLFPLSVIFLGMAASVTGVAGSVLDYAVQTSISFGYNKDLIDAVKTVWGSARDIANMFFIFVLIYIAFATMLQIANFDTKRTLARLVVIGLLLNFSLFFAEIVIDVSNVLAYTAYKAVADTPNAKAATGAAQAGVNQSAALSISSPFVTQMKLTDIYDPKNLQKQLSENKENFLNTLGTAMMMAIIFLLVAAFVFFFSAFLFIARTAVLILLMALAPVAFIAYVLPKTQQYAEKWWETLLKESFFAPIFLFLVWAVLIMIKGLNKNIKGSLLDTFQSKSSSAEVIFAFFLLSALMLGALILAKKMGAHSASLALWGAKGGQRALRLGGKNLIGGALGGSLQRWAKKQGEKGNVRGNYWGNLLGSGLRNRSYDVASIPGMSKTGLTPLKESKDLGQWWKGRQEAERKRKDEVYKGIDPGKDPEGKARLNFLRGLSEKEQEKMYKRLSAQERAEMRMPEDDMRRRLDKALSVEELDKTNKERKHVASHDSLQEVQKIVPVKDANGVRSIDMKDARIAAAANSIPNMEDGHLNKLKPELVGTREILRNMKPAQFKRWVIANEDKIDQNAATEIAGAIRRMTDGEQNDIFEQLHSTKSSSAGATYIKKAMTKAGYEYKEGVAAQNAGKASVQAREEHARSDSAPYSSPLGS